MPDKFGWECPEFHVREVMPARRHRLSWLTNHGGAGYSSPPYAYVRNDRLRFNFEQSSGLRQSQFNFGTPSCAPVVAPPQNKLYGGAYYRGATGLNFWPTRSGEYCADAPAPKSNQKPKRRAPPGEEPHSRLMRPYPYPYRRRFNFAEFAPGRHKRKGASGARRQNLNSRRAVFRQPTSVPPYSEIEAEGDRDRSAANGGISRSGSGSLRARFSRWRSFYEPHPPEPRRDLTPHVRLHLPPPTNTSLGQMRPRGRQRGTTYGDIAVCDFAEEGAN
ncbi:hypothetical protein B0H10DRAFT_2193626 [Mycena sp. CBHHK59/15]|nr:hypothetical protein B0H10DRAFT_2193626 [Mycena sp. CBHHK59/15]